MAPALAADRSVRDKRLAWAMALLFGAGVFRLIADSIRLTDLLESRVSEAHRVVGWLDLISNLPLLAAAAFGFFAFLAVGRERAWWLRRALLLATLGFAIAFIARVLDYGAIESSPPEGMNLALLAACVATFTFAAGSFLAASAVGDGSLRWPSRVLGVAQLCVGLSSWAFTLAYTAYPHHDAFARGLVVEGFGAIAAGLALFYAAAAFKNEPGARGGRLLGRERRLFLAVGALGLSFLLIGLGEAQRAAGTTALGYAESAAVAGWIFALALFVEAAAFLCAALGFKARQTTSGGPGVSRRI
jgi:hypothetical protein